MPSPGPGPRRWIGTLWIGLFVAATAPWLIALSPDTRTLSAEGGVLESAQLGLWSLSVAASIAVAARARGRQARWGTALLGLMASAALARELDLHIWLNPAHLGEWGVRYRIDWWLDGKVPILLKLGWALVGLVVAGVVGLMAYQARGRPRWSEARPRLFVAAGVCLFTGFVCDDLLRNRVDLATAQLVEELAELVGALLFLAAVVSPEDPDVRRPAGVS